MNTNLSVTIETTTKLMGELREYLNSGYQPKSLSLTLVNGHGKNVVLNLDDIVLMINDISILFPSISIGKFESKEALLQYQLLIACIIKESNYAIQRMEEFTFASCRFRFRAIGPMQIFIPSFGRFIDVPHIIVFGLCEEYRELLEKNCKYIYDIYKEGYTYIEGTLAHVHYLLAQESE